MRHHLLIAFCLLGACYHDSGGGAARPPDNTAGAPSSRGPDVSATIADPLGFLPIDSEVVLSLDADQLRQSELWRQYEPALLAKAGADLARFKALCGFDPITSIRGLTVGMKSVGQVNPDGVFVVHGIDRARMLACVGKLSSNDHGVTIDNGVVTAHASKQDPSVVVFQFVDASTAVCVVGPSATKELLARVIRGGSPLRGSPSFLSMLSLIDAQAALWALVNGNSHVFDKTAAMGVKPKALFGSLGLSDGLVMTLRMRLETPQAASSFVALVQGQLGAAKMLFDKLDVTADDADVVFGIGMTSAQVQMFAGLLGGSLGP
jgi:hypothetical protein